ncbi:MAG TPA: NADH-quinone oxidoreductase subunit C [Flavobacterium sp.]|jgi:NADH-quinone oxidoreductase subunit C|uniref:NADH-quinone oxidoreductase subunit C n=1 Tax=Flavobacterium sp. TaxID=239 RepID=UPI002BA8B41C|nr:NADH-quinone oxidoreductase subunit C [Flavobacterium sp.]HPW97415.1 NADH-quinone oxidoreductase subunit C [Flavobacterium sp.]HQA73232.1 NADH-quinone oxidoreductase subunit C [Flavobacterium sp.]
MALETTYIQEKLSQKFGSNVLNFEMKRDIFSLEATSETVHEVIQTLKEDESLNFHFLTDVCGIHFPDNDENHQFAVVYHLHNWIENMRIRVTTFLKGENPEVSSIIDLFTSANWMERETWDFYGINFIGHPQLKRILNMDEMVSFPMRKEFPLEDSGRTDKDDRFFGRTIKQIK